MRQISFILAATLAWISPLQAAAPDHEAVKDKSQVTLERDQSYLVIELESFATALTFIRLPEASETADYQSRRAAALTKAHAKWVKGHAAWKQEVAQWDKLDIALRPPGGRPIEPVEPTDLNLKFPSIEQENMVTIGPLNRFAKDGDHSIYVEKMKPGRYAFYGPVFVGANGLATGTCMCMGTIEFDVPAGAVVNAGTIRNNIFARVQQAAAKGVPAPKDEFDLPEGENMVSWLPPTAGAAIDPRLSAYSIVPAALHASRRFPNWYGLTIDRITALPGVIEYDRDRIVDPTASGSASVAS